MAAAAGVLRPGGLAEEAMMREGNAMLRLSLLVIALAASLPSLGAPAVAQDTAAAPGVRMVELDGRRVRVQALGLETRRQGQPVVVFEAGATSSLDAWRQVVSEVAAQAPVVAYDRAGLGQSEPDALPPAPRHVTGRLSRLLRQIGAEPPYVLVGHSWGGMLIHYYAGHHPEEVVGLVFVDPAPVLTQELSGNLAPFEAIGAGRRGYDAYWSAFGALVGKASPPIRAEFETLRRILETPLAERDLRPLPKVPIAVIVAAKYLPLPILDQMPFDARAYFGADLRHRIGLLQEWVLASPDGLLLVASETTHSVPREAPKLVSWSIGRVLEAAQRTPGPRR